MKIKDIIGFDAIKVQSELMVRMLEDNSRIMSGEMKIDDVDSFIFSNKGGTILYIIPDMLCCVDKEKIYKKFGNSTESIKGVKKGLVENESKYQLIPTGVNIDTNRNGKTLSLVEYKVGDIFVYFDKKLIKAFDGCVFYGNNAKGIASVYYADRLVGAICPVNHKKE